MQYDHKLVECRRALAISAGVIWLLGAPQPGAAEATRPDDAGDVSLLSLPKDADRHEGRGGGDDAEAHDGKMSLGGGWWAQIENGYYQLFDPAGRLVISRKVQQSDLQNF